MNIDEIDRERCAFRIDRQRRRDVCFDAYLHEDIPFESVIRALAPGRTSTQTPFFSVLITILSFLPVFALTGRSGKMFHPLAWTKTFALIGVAILAVTLVPALIPIALVRVSGGTGIVPLKYAVTV